MFGYTLNIVAVLPLFIAFTIFQCAGGQSVTVTVNRLSWRTWKDLPPEVFCCSMILHLNGSGNCGNYCRQYHLFVYVCAGDCSRFIHFDHSVLRLLWWSAVSSDKCQQQPKAKDGAIIESINRHTLTHSQIGSKLGETTQTDRHRL